MTATQIKPRTPRVARHAPVRQRPTLDGSLHDIPVPTPLFTRHMLGAIEAERDQRHQRHAGNPHPRQRGERDARARHPKITAALFAEARDATQASGDDDRWFNEGGSFNPAAIGRAGVGLPELSAR
jgi:hypothetical protein